MSTDWADIERMGAKARASGFQLADNPFLSDAGDTEDTREDWETKRDTWILGWTLEDAFRRQGP
ncbi:CrpP-related protein [Rhizobium sp. 2YAF20]|uniref:CrpP-related protein n=1 Tax=Rhizobium sp. 2YAF20 TaxID=3233027 RepID=UPI003F95CD68